MLHLRSRRLTAAACGLALFGFMLAACSAVTAGSYVNTQVELTRYTTFGWGAPDETPTGDPRLDNNPFFTDRVRAEVERGSPRAATRWRRREPPIWWCTSTPA